MSGCICISLNDVHPIVLRKTHEQHCPGLVACWMLPFSYAIIKSWHLLIPPLVGILPEIFFKLKTYVWGTCANRAQFNERKVTYRTEKQHDDRTFAVISSSSFPISLAWLARSPSLLILFPNHRRDSLVQPDNWIPLLGAFYHLQISIVGNLRIAISSSSSAGIACPSFDLRRHAEEENDKE